MPRVGVTGHFNLADATEKLVYEALENLLRQLSGEVTGVTCLARGADQLFARVVLDAGGSLEVVLPASDYRTKIKSENVDSGLLHLGGQLSMIALQGGRTARRHRRRS